MFDIYLEFCHFSTFEDYVMSTSGRLKFEHKNGLFCKVRTEIVFKVGTL